MLEKIQLHPEKYGTRIPVPGGEPVSGTIVEMTYDPDSAKTGFAIWNGTSLRYAPEFPLADNRFLVPYSARNNLIAHRVIVFPSHAQEYDSEDELVSEIQAYIHRYVDVSPVFEKIASYYVLLTWVYESFNELPYLRLRGDFGTGKTRFLQTVGSICFRPIFASGASTVSPLFRILDAFHGTLIIDEGDFRFSDEKAEIVKILNNGNARGFPVLRSEATGGNHKEFNPVAFDVFGPKLVGTRGFFDDRALESRFISEEMGRGRLREDIPINLPTSFETESLKLRNKLLMFRFHNHGIWKADQALVDRKIEPRLNQIFVPLLTVVKNENVRQQIREVARQYDQEMIADRGFEAEAQILEIIKELAVPGKRQLSIKEITGAFIDRYGADQERPVTAKWLGTLIRRKLRLNTFKSHGAFVVTVPDPLKLDLLCKKYGIEDSDQLTKPIAQPLL